MAAQEESERTLLSKLTKEWGDDQLEFFGLLEVGTQQRSTPRGLSAYDRLVDVLGEKQAASALQAWDAAGKIAV